MPDVSIEGRLPRRQTGGLPADRPDLKRVRKAHALQIRPRGRIRGDGLRPSPLMRPRTFTLALRLR